MASGASKDFSRPRTLLTPRVVVALQTQKAFSPVAKEWLHSTPKEVKHES